MNIKTINIGISKIIRIFHLSDIHIRNLTRHEEYETVFQRTANYIKGEYKEGDIIFLAGDIVHSKCDMSPELIQYTQKFFKLFADIGPTILICGNHDANLNNTSRLDALTPIVNALNHKNLFYLKDTGIYKIANIHFSLLSVFDKPIKFIRAKDFKADYKIALFHGAVNNAVTDAGFKLVNTHVSVGLFEGYDLTLMGDIHLPAQFLNPEKTIGYSGSLLQQSHGEGLLHGILIWDLSTKSAKFQAIENDHCYFTLEIIKGKLTNNIPKQIANKQIILRIRVTDTEKDELRKIVTDIRSKYNITKISYQRINSSSTNTTRINRISIGNVRDIEYQNSLIVSHLKQKYRNLHEDVLDGIRHINRTVNSSLKRQLSVRNIEWIPKYFEFSNMFSYGENNFIDFTNLHGIYGIFGQNAVGKSTLLDSLMYCIFDKCSKASKASLIMNNKSNSFTCKFQFYLDGKDYFIERTATRRTAEHARVEVNFYSVDAENNTISLNGKERSDTNNNIRKILGNYEDFVLTALSTQNISPGFIEMSQRERKDLLAQFLDINVFDELEIIANNDIKEVSTLVKEYQKQKLPEKLASAIQDATILSEKITTTNKSKEDIDKSINELNIRLLQLSEKLIPTLQVFENIEKINTLQQKLELQRKELEKKITAKFIDKQSVDEKITNLLIEINKFDKSKLLENISKLTDLRSKENKIRSELDTYKITVSHKLEKIKNLGEVLFDENCNFCMNNIFVKDAISTKDSLKLDKQKISELIKELDVVEKSIEYLIDSEYDKSKLKNLETSLSGLRNYVNTSEIELSSLQLQLHQSSSELEKVNNTISEYHKQESIIISNKLLNEEISRINIELKELKNSNIYISQELLSYHSKYSVAENIKMQSEDALNKLQRYEKELKLYTLYLEAINRDGVPYELIVSAIPYLEQEINNILSQLVDFNIMLEMDGKNINCYIVYDEDNYWAIELVSGMEKFLSALAIRVALINTSTLPRPNFLAIDEGFTSLDSTNLGAVSNLFDYLKTQFEFLFIISHIDSMRDVVDKIIEIVKLPEGSKIQYS